MSLSGIQLQNIIPNTPFKVTVNGTEITIYRKGKALSATLVKEGAITEVNANTLVSLKNGIKEIVSLKTQSIMSDDDIVAKALCIVTTKMKNNNDFITDEKSASNLATLMLGHETIEKFLVIYLDTQHKLIDAVIEFSGTINQAAVYTREIVKEAIKHNAASIIIAHNHPSGNPAPSQSDKDITIKIQQALALIDVRLLDSIVVGTTTVSLASRGFL